MQNTLLWRTMQRNTLLSIILFGTLMGVLWIAEIVFPSMQGQLLKWNDVAWVVGIPASIIGVAYILTIRDPQNYTGFYAGIVMSALLGAQFWLQGGYDSTFLYLCVFIPFQIKSIINWSKPADNNNEEPFRPEYLNTKTRWISILLCISLVCADYILSTYAFQQNGLTENIAVKLCNGILIASSILANFWLIYRKINAWFYWILYSLAGIVLFIILGNIFSIVLFCFFLVINSMAGIAWIKLAK